MNAGNGDNRQIIGFDTTLSHIFKNLDHVSTSDENVFITGETGTGKEVFAREIHRRSKRKLGPFIKINCGAIPETLIESELFGFTKGSFSGAYRDKEGKIEEAPCFSMKLQNCAGNCRFGCFR